MNHPSENQSQQEMVDAYPVKSFFVHMLTRDIALEDAILDLLDNCIDGILRTHHGIVADTPYKNFNARIVMDRESFSITDNCGGIPWENRKYAFKLGRDYSDVDSGYNTIGTYGIGMKRAMFKMGEQSVIQTKTADISYTVTINKEWLSSEDWNLPLFKNNNELTEPGTKIQVTQLRSDVSAIFESPDFISGLRKKISSHYAFIIAKGFNVFVNEEEIIGLPTKLIFGQPEGIQPYVYKDTIDGVEVFLAVGFSRPVSSQAELDSEAEYNRYSSIDAGWTVICNDRAVLYCNRDELTGWGETGIPKYHTQFIAISGIVEFRCKNASLLPMTTTKRGVDASSLIYLQAKNKMREGMKLFIDYTNRWKKDSESVKKQFESANKSVTLVEIKQKVATGEIQLAQKKNGCVYMPSLPSPPKGKANFSHISFTKLNKEIELVKNFVFSEDVDHTPSETGEACFDYFLKKAKE